MILSNIPYFCQNGGLTHFFRENPKSIEPSCSIFFGRRYDGMKGFPADFRPKFGRKIDIRPEIDKKQILFFKKNRFFRFFQKLSKSIVNIEFCLKNTLNTPRGQFLPIFHHISQYKHLEKSIFLDENRDFLRFLRFFEFWWCDRLFGRNQPEMRNLAGNDPLDPQDTST